MACIGIFIAQKLFSFPTGVRQEQDLFVRLIDSVTKTVSSLQGPVVQSIVSLTSSLRGQLVKCFMTL